MTVMTVLRNGNSPVSVSVTNAIRSRRHRDVIFSSPRHQSEKPSPAAEAVGPLNMRPARCLDSLELRNFETFERRELVRYAVLVYLGKRDVAL